MFKLFTAIEIAIEIACGFEGYSNFIGLCDTIAEESVASEHRKIVQVNNVFEVRPKGIGVS